MTDKFGQVMTVVRQAGQILIDNFDQNHANHKKGEFDYDIELDQTLDKFYKQKLSQIEPEAEFYSEENQDQIKANKKWIVDSIEGTTNFTCHNKFFATQCALETNGQIELAVVFAPLLKEIYAVKNNQTFFNDQVMHIPQINDLSRCVFSVGKGTSRENRKLWHLIMGEMLNHYHTPRLFGATGLELGLVARGSLDFLILAGSNYYDIAPGLALVRQAGGVGINLQGNNWQQNDTVLIAGQTQVAQDVLTKLQKVVK